MKLKIPAYKTIFHCTILAIVGAVLIGGATIMIFLDWPWGWKQYFIIAIWAASTVALFVLSLTQNFYVLEKNFICHHKFRKEMYYNFKDIIYIDTEYSEKHKTSLFVTNKGDIRYIPFDKERLIHQALLEKCKNLISFEELIVKFPQCKKIR